MNVSPSFKNFHSDGRVLRSENIYCRLFYYLCLIHLIIGFERIVEMLIEKGANINAVNRDNNSALILAAKNSNTSRELYI